MSIVVEAPKEYYGILRSRWPSLFLAGGITGCEDWQTEVIKQLEGLELIIYNPRRADFPIGDPTAAEIQICWEYDKLAKADVVCFWFAYGTDNPIVLYELGIWGNGIPTRPIAVGCDLQYSRKLDVEIQTQLARPEVFVVSKLGDLVWTIKNILRAMAGLSAESAWARFGRK